MAFKVIYCIPDCSRGMSYGEKVGGFISVRTVNRKNTACEVVSLNGAWLTDAGRAVWGQNVARVTDALVAAVHVDTVAVGTHPSLLTFILV